MNKKIYQVRKDLDKILAQSENTETLKKSAIINNWKSPVYAIFEVEVKNKKWEIIPDTVILL